MATRPPSTAHSGLMPDIAVLVEGPTIPSAILEFGVPVQIVAPAVWRVAQTDRDADGRHRLRSLGPLHEMHARFVRSATALPAVARHAAGNDVLPVLSAALGDRHHMIEGELACGKLIAAVLTGMVVARVNVRARKRYVVEPAFDFDVAEKPDHRRELDSERHRSYFPVVFRDHFDFSLVKQGDGFLPVNHLERFI